LVGIVHLQRESCRNNRRDGLRRGNRFWCRTAQPALNSRLRSNGDGLRFVQNSVVGGNGGGTPFGGGGAGGDAYGGAIFNNSSLTLRNCCFAGNAVAGGNGGAGSAAG